MHTEEWFFSEYSTATFEAERGYPENYPILISEGQGCVDSEFYSAAVLGWAALTSAIVVAPERALFVLSLRFL